MNMDQMPAKCCYLTVSGPESHIRMAEKVFFTVIPTSINVFTSQSSASDTQQLKKEMKLNTWTGASFHFALMLYKLFWRFHLCISDIYSISNVKLLFGIFLNMMCRTEDIDLIR